VLTFLKKIRLRKVKVPQLPKTIPRIARSASTPQTGKVIKDMLERVGRELGSIAWTSALSHLGGYTSNVFKIAIKYKHSSLKLYFNYVILYGICENMVFQAPPIIYAHPVYIYIYILCMYLCHNIIYGIQIHKFLLLQDGFTRCIKIIVVSNNN
jgi:hypothetical protein